MHEKQDLSQTRSAHGLTLPRVGIGATWSALLLATVACYDPTSTGNETREGPSRPRMTLDCRLGEIACLGIDQAITYLENSSQLHCRQRGAAARGRFEAFGYGFRGGSGASNPSTARWDMYTSWDYDMLSQSYRTDMNTYVNVSGTELFTEEKAGLIAHEEVHHSLEDDDQHTSSIAIPTGYACQLG